MIKQMNVDRRSFSELLNKFNSEVEAGDEVFFFFAGHGVSVNGDNYLLPIDIPKIELVLERLMYREAFLEDEVIKIARERGAKVSILIIDACRKNPFTKQNMRSIDLSVGLARSSMPPHNTFVMYSAGIGQEALDSLSTKDTTPHSVFTCKLLPLLKTPSLSHIHIAKQLQIEVRDLALTAGAPFQNHKQFPSFYDQIEGFYYFLPSNQIKSNKIPQKKNQ